MQMESSFKEKAITLPRVSHIRRQQITAQHLESLFRQKPNGKKRHGADANWGKSAVFAIREISGHTRGAQPRQVATVQTTNSRQPVCRDYVVPTHFKHMSPGDGPYGHRHLAECVEYVSDYWHPKVYTQSIKRTPPDPKAETFMFYEEEDGTPFRPTCVPPIDFTIWSWAQQQGFGVHGQPKHRFTMMLHH